ncbi:MAG: FemAB family XrtA/PEP-CTERM system-associated protein [Thermodesulfobacteriota bacterium]
MTEIYCNAISQEKWDSFVNNIEKSTMAHLYGWKNVIKKTYGHKSYYFHLEKDGEIKSILPLCYIDSKLFGRKLVSMPFLDYGGLCSKDQSVDRENHFPEILQKIISLSKEIKADIIELRHLENHHLSWASHQEKVTMLLALQPTEELMWQALPSERRNRIRKAQKNDLSTSIGALDIIDEFYRTFAVNMRDLGSPVHSKRFFINIIEEFPAKTKIMLVKHQSMVIGAALCFIHNNTISIPWVSSLRSHFDLYPNNILYWDAMKFAISQGCTCFDFGRSSHGSGTFLFKKRWGATPKQLYWDMHMVNAEVNSNHKISNPNYQFALKIWQKLPVAVSCIIGPPIRKNISN